MAGDGAREGRRRELVCSGQDAVDADGFAGTGRRFASTVLGVAQLASPQLLVALEATAMDRARTSGT